jgi:molecular chaperone GrpE
MNVKTSDTGVPGPGGDPADHDSDLPAMSSGDLAVDPDTEAPVSELREGTVPGEDSAAAQLYKDRWLRSEAEMQNFRRRAQRDVEEARRFAEDRMLLVTIDHLDDFERALDAAREAGAPLAWTEGVELAARGMRDHLARHGAIEIAAVGEPFNPAVHEAMLEVDAPAGVLPGHVVQVARTGYQRGGRALRPARVIVARSTGD